MTKSLLRHYRESGEGTIEEISFLASVVFVFRIFILKESFGLFRLLAKPQLRQRFVLYQMDSNIISYRLLIYARKQNRYTGICM